MQAFSIMTVSGDPTVIHPSGEVDMATAPELRQHVEVALRRGRGPVVVDCGAVTFLDAAGLAVLVRFANLAGSRGRLAVLRNIPPPLARVLAVTQVDRRFADGMAGSRA